MENMCRLRIILCHVNTVNNTNCVMTALLQGSVKKPGFFKVAV